MCCCSFNEESSNWKIIFTQNVTVTIPFNYVTGKFNFVRTCYSLCLNAAHTSIHCCTYTMNTILLFYSHSHIMFIDTQNHPFDWILQNFLFSRISLVRTRCLCLCFVSYLSLDLPQPHCNCAGETSSHSSHTKFQLNFFYFIFVIHFERVCMCIVLPISSPHFDLDYVVKRYFEYTP